VLVRQLALAVIEPTVGAIRKLRKVAKVVVVVDLRHGHSSLGSTGNASRDRERTSTVGVGVDLEKVLNTGLAGLVSELDEEVHLGLISSDTTSLRPFAEVGGALGVLVVAVGGDGIGGDVLDTIVKAMASALGGGAGDGGYLDALEDLVGKGTELVLNMGSDDRVVGVGAGRNVNGFSVPDTAVDVEELEVEFARQGGGGCRGCT